MDDLLMLAGELLENNNYKNDNNYEEKKPDGDYNIVIESIALKESNNTGTEWFNIVAKVIDGEYAEEKFYISLFLTEKTIKTTLAKLMKLIDACGFELDLAMFNDKITIEEGLQNTIGSTLMLNKKTSAKGFINYTFSAEGEE